MNPSGNSAAGSTSGVFGCRACLGAAAVAAGILLAITISDLLPEALDHAGRTVTSFGFVMGFLLSFTMEALSKAHVHHHGADDEHLGRRDGAGCGHQQREDLTECGSAE